jgi:hypothetical protein
MEVGGTITFHQMTVEGDLQMGRLRVDDRSQPHTLPPGWQIEPGESSTGQVVADGVPVA